MVITYQLSETATMAWVPCPDIPATYRRMASDCDNGGAWWFSDLPLMKGTFSMGEFAKWTHIYPKQPKPGDVIECRQEWQIERGIYTPKLLLKDGSYAYPEFDDLNQIPMDWEDMHGEWQPAATMPAFAVRRFAVVKTLRACKACDVTPEEGRLIGYTSFLPEWGVVWQCTIGDAWQHWGWLVEVQAESEVK